MVEIHPERCFLSGCKVALSHQGAEITEMLSVLSSHWDAQERRSRGGHDHSLNKQKTYSGVLCSLWLDPWIFWDEQPMVTPQNVRCTNGDRALPLDRHMTAAFFFLRPRKHRWLQWSTKPRLPIIESDLLRWTMCERLLGIAVAVLVITVSPASCWKCGSCRSTCEVRSANTSFVQPLQLRTVGRLIVLVLYTVS